MIAISGPVFAARDLGTCMHIPDQCWGALAGLCGPSRARGAPGGQTDTQRQPPRGGIH